MAANTHQEYPGYKWFKTCNCGGILKHKYRNVNDATKELHIMPNRGRFRLLQGSRLIKDDVLAVLSSELN